ncbi:MAG: polysaccharide biosynthesis tyrosine autokinase [Xanthomonadales bacterium PRO6]|nr:Iron-sulfur cluster carrier protein [Xanthomonadales bacterium]MCE7931737.1 polysaccharide biosynthesis tyrosine autokinase [Xanthomonadales bacterium PRO6]
MQDMASEHPADKGAGLPTPIGPRTQQLAPLDPRMQALSTLVRGADAAAEESDFDLLKYWHVIVKRKWTVLSMFVIVLLTGIMMTMLQTPMYRATATIQIERDNIRTVTVPGVQPLDSGLDYEFYETQFELLRSRSMAEKVAAGLDPDDPVFAVMSAPSPLGKLIQMVLGFDGDAEAKADPEAKRRQLVWLVRGGLGVEPVKASRLVRIHFDSPDAALSAKIANTIAERFIESNMDRRVDNNAYARKFLEDRLEQVKLKLQDSEKALAEYAQREQIIKLEGRETLMSGDLAALNSALTLARQERIEAEARMRQGSGVAAYSHPLMLENAGIQALRATRGKLEAEYQEKLLIYKPGYPLMVQLKSQIEQIDKQLEAEVKLIKAGLQAAFQAAVDKEQMLQQQADATAKNVLEMQGRTTNLTLLEREVETNRQLYDALLQRYKEIGITANVDANNVSIVDTALTPGGPYSPDVMRSVMLAAVSGLVIGVLLAFLFEYLDDTLKRPDEIEKLLGIGVLGVIPKLDGISPEDASLDQRSAFSEAYRSVRTSLQFSTEAGVPRCLLVTSASAGEGKTTTALTLARNLAQLGRRVLLIDGDLRNPSLHRVLGSDNSIGLSNFLAGGIKPAAAIKPTKTLRLTFIPSGPLPPNPAELLAGPKMVTLLSLAAEKFDQVIIDGPPIMGLADSPILANLSAGTLLVVESGSTRVATAKEALKRLIGARAHVVGALITKFDARNAGYGYGYGGDYGGYQYYAYGGSQQPRLAKES